MRAASQPPRGCNAASEDGVVRDASFEGVGCAIATASASLMTEALKGKTEAEAEALFGRFHDMVTTPAAGQAPSCVGIGQADGAVRRARISRARELWDACVAYAACRAA
jgi:NifU-like protein involved in Fe-S cluster formation